MSLELIEGAEKLTRVFGRWPSFHDAEVLRVELDHSGPEGPTLDCDLHVFEMTSAVDPTGHYVLKNHTRVHFRFTSIRSLRLEDFNNQNILVDLTISKEGSLLKIGLNPSHGVDANFECRRAIVVDATAFLPGR